jgi:hypothetical protein
MAKNTRFIFFGITVLIGLMGGWYYGQFINPMVLADTTPNMLREDYQTDYVLMVAEAYSVEKNIQAAVERMGALGGADPTLQVQAAMAFALELGYPTQDLLIMRNLAEAFALWNSLENN